MADTKAIWLDLGPGEANFFHSGQYYGPHETWQDHGLGLLATIAKQGGYEVDTASLGQMPSWAAFRHGIKKYDLLLMNIRSWRYPVAVKAARIAKSANPNIRVVVGGFHATVAVEEMTDVPEFDVIVQGPGEGVIRNIHGDPLSLPRLMPGSEGKYRHLDDLPFIDRTLFPKLPYFAYKGEDLNPWPMESYVGWGPGPKVATVMTARACPWTCHFCYPAEQRHFGKFRRRSVDSTIEELKFIDTSYGPTNSVVFHDAEFYCGKPWLESFLEKYPRETPNWPYWAAGRADMFLKWSDLFTAMLTQTAWTDVSIGLESGSQRVLDILHKGTSVEQNEAVIELVNKVGDDLESQGKDAPRIFANLMVAIPGEAPEDAFATFRMAAKIKRCVPSFAWFTPYPGSVLGDKLRSEHRVVDQALRIYDRTPGRDRVVGVDYNFYRDLWNGRYDREVGFSVREFLNQQGKR